jgi:hypothetical protein
MRGGFAFRRLLSTGVNGHCARIEPCFAERVRARANMSTQHWSLFVHRSPFLSSFGSMLDVREEEFPASTLGFLDFAERLASHVGVGATEGHADEANGPAEVRCKHELVRFPVLTQPVACVLEVITQRDLNEV